VFAPFLWTCRPKPVKQDSILSFHDEHHNPIIDLGSQNREQHAFIAEKERLAEDVRLAYVAITRARAKTYLAWGDVGNARMSGQPAKTALGYLIHPGQSPSDLDANFPWAFARAEQISEHLQDLVEAGEGSIEVVPLAEVEHGTNIAPAPVHQQIESKRFGRKLANDWHISSFTGLTRDIHQVAHGGSTGISGDLILDFPAGSHVGLLMHSVLEHLDFSDDIKSQCDALLPRFAPRYGLDSADMQKTLAMWVKTLVGSPLNESGLTLSALSTGQRLNEMAFDFALDSLSIGALNDLLADISAPGLIPASVDNFRGMITGVIDLVFEYEGKYYLADYKTNYLGASLEDYSQDKLKRAILDRRYDLQYLLYAVALHRYLAQRIPDYSYERHFGGVYYLFIRAMRPQHGQQYGVYYHLPGFVDLNALDTLLAASDDGGQY
jgi:exodeoxyribonuclease V beta subunit